MNLEHISGGFKSLFGVIAALILTLTAFGAHAQLPSSSPIYKLIMTRDSLLFDVGFNTCDISRFEELLSRDFEFYHDVDSISDRDRFLNQLKKGLCSSPGAYQSRRELMPGSTEIYPLYKKGIPYGVIQNGSHRFYEKVGDKPEIARSTAKFTHVWLLQEGSWRLARSLSFDHQMPE